MLSDDFEMVGRNIDKVLIFKCKRLLYLLATAKQN